MEGSTEIVHDFYPRFRVYEDGRVERFKKMDIVPPTNDPKTGIESKDVVISSETGASARLFKPTMTSSSQKLPLLIYIHGGAFSLFCAFSSAYHNYVSSLVAEAKVIAVSVEYRLAPENPLPACYDDSWAVIQWVMGHITGNGPDPWINDLADLGRIFMAGDSAGANIAHNMLAKAGDCGGFGAGLMKVLGVVLIHPFFGANVPELIKFWMCICPDSTGVSDLRLNPLADLSRLSKLACHKVLVCVAENDTLREIGVAYYEALKRSGWDGEIQIVETEGKEHVFHLFDPGCDKAVSLLKQVASFINQA